MLETDRRPGSRARGPADALDNRDADLAGLAVLAVLALVVLTVLLPALVGGRALTVRSGSMTPTLPVGSLIVDRPVDVPDVHLGDVVTYERTIAAGRGW